MDPVLLWLWCKPAAAAPIQLLALVLPFTAGAAVKREKKKKFLIFLSCKKRNAQSQTLCQTYPESAFEQDSLMIHSHSEV